MLAATVSITLVGRRLGVPILGAALLLSGALAALAAGLGLAWTVALLTVAGASRAATVPFIPTSCSEVSRE
jgi:hypothetical protein